METDFVTFPTPIALIAGITEWSSPFFLSLLPFLYITLGIIIAALIAKWLPSKILSSLYNLLIHKNLSENITENQTTMTGAEANIDPYPSLNVTKKSTADSYWAAKARGDKEAMARIAKQDSMEQRGLIK